MVGGSTTSADMVVRALRCLSDAAGSPTETQISIEAMFGLLQALVVARNVSLPKVPNMQEDVSSNIEGPAESEAPTDELKPLPAFVTPFNVVQRMRIQSRTFKDLPPWPGIAYLPMYKLRKEVVDVLQARRTRSRRQAAQALGLSYAHLRDLEREGLKVIERHLRRER